jgi:general secretion pathway protein D
MAQPAAEPAQPPSDAMIAARRNEAARELARANGLFEEKKYAEAISAYNNTRTTYGDVLTAEQSSQLASNLSASQQAMASAATATPAPSGAAQPSGALSTFQQNTTIAKQQALAEFNNDLMQAAKALEQSNIDEARQLAARAQLKLDSRRMLFSEPERNELATRVTTLRADIEKKGDELAAAERTRRENELAVAAARGAEAESALKASKIREHIDRVRALQRERKYSEALQICDQILFLDPENPTGNLLRDVLRDMEAYSAVASIDSEKSRTYADLAIENSRSLIAPTSIVNYPKDWPNISNIRSEALAFQDTVDNRRVIAALDNTRIPKAELADTPFEAALKYLQTFANVNMDIDWASLEAIGVQKDTTISLNLTNPTVKTVLEQVLNKAAPSLDLNSRASWTVYDGVLHIGSEPALRKNKVMVIYDVQDLLFEVRDKVDVPELDLQAAFQNTGGGGGGGGGGQSPFGQGNQNNQRQPGQGLQRPIEDRIRDLRNIIVEQVDKDGWEDGGGDTGTIQVFQQNLIVTNTPKNHRAIEGLLSQLRRVRNMQINVEARFLVVASDFFEKIGFDVDLYLNANGNQVRFLRGFNYAFMPNEFFPDGRYGGNNANSANKVFDSDNDGIPDAPLANGGPAAPPPENFSVVGIANGSLGLASRLMTSPFASEVTGSGTAAPALGISGTFLDDVQVDFLLEATQADRRAVSLNAPRLTFTNGQTANVYVARQIAYISDLEPVIADQSVAFDPQPGFVNDGVTLLVSGVILADRRYVQLDVETRVSNYPEDRIRRIPVNAGAAGGGGAGGGGGGAPANVTGLIELPQGQIQSVSTTVTVPDQGTVLLGGQRLTNEVEVESGVPVLGKIPILNRFFSNRSISREERTLLMLIRPQILIQDETEDRFFPGLRDAIRTGGFGS